jgi:hypothetical protein
MTFKELSGVYYISKEIEAIELEIEKLRTTAEKITSVISDMPRGGGNVDKLTDIIAQIADYQAELADALIRKANEQIRISKYIDSIDDITIRSIFRLRFLSLYQWEEVAARIGGNNTEGSCKMMCHRYIRQQNEEKPIC